MDRQCLSIPEAAKILGVSRGTLYRKVKDGLFPAIKIPGKERPTYRIPKDTLINVLTEGLGEVRKEK